MTDFVLLRTTQELQTESHIWKLTEPVLADYLDLCRSLLSIDDRGNTVPNPLIHRGIMLNILRPWLYKGDIETVSPSEASAVLDALYRMIYSPVIDIDPQDKSADRPNPYDLSYTGMLDLVGNRYGIDPITLSRQITLRQLQYLYVLAYNASQDQTEQQITLAGGKLKKPLKRLRLLCQKDKPASVDTSSMTPREKARYYSQLRRQEGREPGRLKA